MMTAAHITDLRQPGVASFAPACYMQQVSYRFGSNLARPRFVPVAGMVRDDSEKVLDLERLWQVVVATAGENLLPVTRHGEGGNRDHRNSSRLLVGLEATRRVYARYVR